MVNNYIIAPGEGPGSYTETIPFNLPADSPVGIHTLRAKANWNAPVPDDACEETAIFRRVHMFRNRIPASSHSTRSVLQVGRIRLVMFT